MIINKILVTGASGFIGRHLVRHLKSMGYWVRGVDRYAGGLDNRSCDEQLYHDLNSLTNCYLACSGVDAIIHLAADTGGVTHIARNSFEVMSNNLVVDANIFKAVRTLHIKKLFYASSSYSPRSDYSWAKLTGERMASALSKESGVDVRIGRLHGVYGSGVDIHPFKSRAPAAICRKVHEAEDGGEIEVLGNGKHIRSYCHVGDCVKAVYKLLMSDCGEPVDIRSDSEICINDLLDMICGFAGKNLAKKYVQDCPQGSKLKSYSGLRASNVLDWEPSVDLGAGMADLYAWIGSAVR